MNRPCAFRSGVALGAAGMYLFDPVQGRRRRAVLRDKFLHAGRQLTEAADTAARDLSQRARGVLAETRSLFAGEPATDEVLVQRVRARMGRAVSHPRAISVTAQD